MHSTPRAMASPASTSAPARPRAFPPTTRRCGGRPLRPALHPPRLPPRPAATPAPSGPGRPKNEDGDPALPSSGAMRIAEAFVAYDPSALAVEAGVVDRMDEAAAAALLLVDQPADEEAPSGAGKRERER